MADNASGYLRRIATVPLLGAADEVALAFDIEAGVLAFERVLLADELDHRTLDDLCALMRIGSMAWARMVQANLRLVVSVARRFYASPVPFSDLVQEGNLGLIRAVERYDFRRGNKFSTYARWWIHEGVSRAAAEQSRTVRIPVQVHDQLHITRVAHEAFRRRHDRPPTSSELATATGLPLRRVRELLALQTEAVSIDGTFGEAARLGDVLVDPDALDAAEQVSLALTRERLDDALATLDRTERQVLRALFGFDGTRLGAAQIGRELGLSRDRVRGVEEAALRKIRRHPASRMLRGITRE